VAGDARGPSDEEIHRYLMRWTNDRHGPWIDGFREVARRYQACAEAARDLVFEMRTGTTGGFEGINPVFYDATAMDDRFRASLDHAVAQLGCEWEKEAIQLLSVVDRGVVHAGPGDTAESIETYGFACRRLAMALGQMLSICPDPKEEARKARRRPAGNGGAFQDLEIQKLLQWAGAEGLGLYRLAGRLHAGGFRAKPGGTTTPSTKQWYGRLKQAQRRMRERQRASRGGRNT
jgi:hypothetical protein